MSFAKSILTASVLALAVPFAAGCSGAPDAESAVEANADQSDEAELRVSDTSLLNQLEHLVQGLETGGGEGDADPYKVMSYMPKRGESYNDTLILKRLLSQMIPMEDSGDDKLYPGMQERPAADEWADLISDEPQTAAKWRAVKSFYQKNLKGVRTMTLGWSFRKGGSIETGAVAHVIVGQSASGRVIAIWGIDIWT